MPGVLRTVFRLVSRNWAYGGLVMVLPSGESIEVKGSEPGPEGRLVIKDYRCMRRVLAAGGIGLAEGYMAGWVWRSPWILSKFSDRASKRACRSGVSHSPAM